MKPMKAGQTQTYVSQYVPQPFELMQRAADKKQAQYDELEASLDASEAFMGAITTHSGTPTDELQGYLKPYKERFN